MRHLLVKLALIGFVCRALVPAGFMPATIADGGPIRFCHGGAAGALLTALVEQRYDDARSSAQDHLDGRHRHGHGGDERAERAHYAGDVHHDPHSGHEQDASHEGWDRCPVGTAFALAVLASDFALPLLSLEHDFDGSSADLLVLRLRPAHYHARAPPRV